MADDHNFPYFPPCFMGDKPPSHMGCYALFDDDGKQAAHGKKDQLEKKLENALCIHVIFYPLVN